MRTVSYQTNTAGEPKKAPGLFYDYIMARNGLFISAGNRFMEAAIRIAEAEVRGLEPIEERVKLIHGPIPRRLYTLALGVFMAKWREERYVAITWNGDYHIVYPAQESTEDGVDYEKVSDTVMEIHSHATMGASFSGIDNRDEQGMGLFMVIGRLDHITPEYSLRAGVYGYFKSMRFEEVFQ